MDKELTLAAVVVASKDFKRIERTVRYLARQTIADRMELVIVAARPMPEVEAFTAFGRTNVITVGYIENVDVASADGILAATAHYIASVEDHAYPEPTWAENIVAAFEQGYDVIGSQMGNANPTSGLSGANLLIAYGPQTSEQSQGVKSVPSHNCAYRAALIQPLGERLYSLMGRGGKLMAALREQGATFYHAGSARLTHANPSRLSSSAELRFNAGRAYATGRARHWSLPKRLVYTALAPLIPFIRLRNFYSDYFASGERQRGELAPLLLALAFDAAGQAAGYLLGEGNAGRVLATFEMGRLQHLTAHDRTKLAY